MVFLNYIMKFLAKSTRVFKRQLIGLVKIYLIIEKVKLKTGLLIFPYLLNNLLQGFNGSFFVLFFGDIGFAAQGVMGKFFLIGRGKVGEN